MCMLYKKGKPTAFVRICYYPNGGAYRGDHIPAPGLTKFTGHLTTAEVSRAIVASWRYETDDDDLTA